MSTLPTTKLSEKSLEEDLPILDGDYTDAVKMLDRSLRLQRIKAAAIFLFAAAFIATWVFGIAKLVSEIAPAVNHYIGVEVDGLEK